MKADTFDPSDLPVVTSTDELEAVPESESAQPEAAPEPPIEESVEEVASEAPPSSTGNGSAAGPKEEPPPSDPVEEPKEQQPPASDPPRPPSASPGAADTLLSLIQDARASAGLGSLQRHAGADSVAQAWAEQMAANGTLAHNPNFATQLWSAVGEGAVAENVGHIRPADPGAMHQRFMGSAGHRANLLGDFTYVGVGAAEDAEGALWVVQTFVQPN